MQEDIAALKDKHAKAIEDMKGNMTEKDASVEEKNQALEGLEQEKKELELKASKYQVCTVLFIYLSIGYFVVSFHPPVVQCHLPHCDGQKRL